MAIRKYLCRMIGGTGPDDKFRAEIYDEPFPDAAGFGVQGDLRTFEDYRDKAGVCYVAVSAPDAFLDALEVKYGLTPITAGTAKAAIDAKIGSEAADEEFRNPEEYLSRVADRRAARRTSERERSR